MIGNIKNIIGSLKDKNSSGRTIALVSLASLISNFLTIISGLIVARWLLPKDLGMFNTFSIITSYIILIQLGVPSGLSRDYPYYLGKGNKQRALHLASVANYWSLLLGIVVMVVAIAISIYYLITKQYQNAAGVFVIGVTSFEAFYVSKYLKILFRSTDDFNKLSYINIIMAFVQFAGIAFVWKFGFYGLCMRAIAVSVIDLIITWKWKPVDAKPEWNKKNYKALLKVGMPIYWVANIYSLWPIFQRTLVLSIGGTTALGLYGLALMVENGMQIISQSVSSVAFPKMSLAWGKNHRFNDLINIAFKPVVTGFFFNIVLVVAGWFLLPWFIKLLLPNFAEGTYAAQWSLIVGLISIFTVFSNVYMVIQKNMSRMVSYIAGFAVWLLALFILYKTKGFSLEIFPQAMCIAYFGIYAIDIYFFKKFSVAYDGVKNIESIKID